MKWRIIFLDGTSEEYEGGVWPAWVYGKIKAAVKGTTLLNLEPLDEEARSLLRRRLIVPGRA